MCRQRSLLSLFCHVSDSIVRRFLVGLVPAATAEGSVVNLPAIHWAEPAPWWWPRISWFFVWLWTTTYRPRLGHCLAIVKSMPLVPLTTVSLGQAQDAWWFRQLEEFLGLFRCCVLEVKNLYASRLGMGKNSGLWVKQKTRWQSIR